MKPPLNLILARLFNLPSGVICIPAKNRKIGSYMPYEISQVNATTINNVTPRKSVLMETPNSEPIQDGCSTALITAEAGTP